MKSAESEVERRRRATAATVRALAQTEHEVRFTQGTAAGDFLAEPPESPEKLPSYRGRADALAVRLRYHDAATHGQFAPTDSAARGLYDALEQTRCELLCGKQFIGVRENLLAALEARLTTQGASLLYEKHQTQLPEAIELLTRELLSDCDLPPAARPLMTLWRGELQTKLAPFMHQLSDNLGNQKAFATASRKLLNALGLSAETEPLQHEQDPDPAQDAEQAHHETEAQDEMQPEPGQLAEDSEQLGTLEAGLEEIEQSQQQQLRPAEDGEDIPTSPPRYLARDHNQFVSQYQVFTQQFDEILSADALCDAHERNLLRQQLDRQLQSLRGLVSRLANRLQRRLLARQSRAWEFDLEEGILNTATLARVVADPSNPLSFMRERQTEFRDTIVTLLIDNSGSMRGLPITIAAMSADILARTLERCGVKSEILGFTTRAWKGGQSRERWLNLAKPANPGRLNDLRHIIYKAADTPWRRARSNLGVMLREGILKENIDGEALLWAHERLTARPEQRRILMVISDGAPVDDSTLSVNPGNYLDQHLREVISYIENHSVVELAAIGIGHDVTRYYQRAATIVNAEQLSDVMIEKLGELFELTSTPPRSARNLSNPK